MSVRTALADRVLRPFFLRPLPERLLMRAYEWTSIKNLLKLAPVYYAYPSGTRRQCTRWGIRFDLDISVLDGWSIYVHRRRHAAIARQIGQGHVVFDVGANLGEIALVAASRVGPTGRVFAFEPNPAIFESLQRNVALNPELSCTPVNMALGAREQEVEMAQIDRTNPGTMTVRPTGMQRGRAIAGVPMIPLDQYVSGHALSHIDLIKIDVEGYELQVLQGAVQTLSRYRPRLVIELCDSHQRLHGESAASLVDWLEKAQYEVRSLKTGTSVRSTDPLTDCFLDILCVPRGRDEDVEGGGRRADGMTIGTEDRRPKTEDWRPQTTGP